MKVTINGDIKEVTDGHTVASLLASLSLDPQKVAVERNLEIVPKSTFSEVLVENNDQFEIVHFIGGGIGCE